MYWSMVCRYVKLVSKLFLYSVMTIGDSGAMFVVGHTSPWSTVIWAAIHITVPQATGRVELLPQAVNYVVIYLDYSKLQIMLMQGPNYDDLNRDQW